LQSDIIQEGIYYFGGKNKNNQMTNKMRYLKPLCQYNKVISAEWIKIK